MMAIRAVKFLLKTRCLLRTDELLSWESSCQSVVALIGKEWSWSDGASLGRHVQNPIRNFLPFSLHVKYVEIHVLYTCLVEFPLAQIRLFTHKSHICYQKVAILHKGENLSLFFGGGQPFEWIFWTHAEITVTVRTKYTKTHGICFQKRTPGALMLRVKIFQ